MTKKHIRTVHSQLVKMRWANFELAIFLLACLVLGGTSQDIVLPKFIVYLLSLVVIGRRILLISSNSLLNKLKPVLFLCVAFFLLSASYAIPLPYAVWSSMPGRDVVVEGYKLAGLGEPWLPLSLTPEKTVFSLLDFFPPFAMILLVGTRQRYFELEFAFLILATFVIVSVALAGLQASQMFEGLYIYDFTNKNAGVGFFSNANHFSIFLILCLPFMVFKLSIINKKAQARISKTQGIFVAAIFSIVCGVSFSGSFAGFLMLGPVVLILLYVWSREYKIAKSHVFITVGAVLVFMIPQILFSKNILTALTLSYENIGEDARHVMRATALEAARDFFPVGSGLGSFSDVYRLFEDFGEKTIPHAHNEYFELFVELGLLGVIWTIIVLAYIAKNVWKAFTAKDGYNSLSRYMAVVLVTIIIHSSVDYGTRTIAIMVLIVFALCLMVAPSRRFQKA